jgi:heptosyltransferase-2
MALHPGSGSERKNWPEGSWGALLERLAKETEASFLLVGGEAEGERLRRLATLLPPARVQLAQSLPLAHLAALLSSCRNYMGHDSGITHLAAALGLPGLVLWGESREQVWRPRSDRMELLRAPDGLAALPTEVVFEAVRAQLEF